MLDLVSQSATMLYYTITITITNYASSSLLSSMQWQASLFTRKQNILPAPACFPSCLECAYHSLVLRMFRLQRLSYRLLALNCTHHNDGMLLPPLPLLGRHLAATALGTLGVLRIQRVPRAFARYRAGGRPTRLNRALPPRNGPLNTHLFGCTRRAIRRHGRPRAPQLALPSCYTESLPRGDADDNDHELERERVRQRDNRHAINFC